MSLKLAYIGLGSNLASPIEQVRQALDELTMLPLSRLVTASSLYASRPVGPQDQPDFINAVAALETRLSPLALLDQLQADSVTGGRVRWILICCSTPTITSTHPACASHTRT